MSELPEGVTRSAMPPFLRDIVRISNPDIIRKVAASPDIARPAEVNLPWLLKKYFPATKFYYRPDDLLFIAMQGDESKDRPARRRTVEDLLAKGFSGEHITRLVQLVRGTDEDRQIGAECAKIVAELILPLPPGEELPDEIALASFDTVTNLQEFFNPLKYFRARSARKKVENYCASLLPNEQYVGDWAHNLGAASQGLGKAILSMRHMVGPDVRHHFTSNPVTQAVMRMPIRDSTVGGIFPEDAPVRADDTVIILEIAMSAKETHDDLFLFGTGINDRQCPFRNLFYSTTESIRNQLLSAN